MAILTLLFGIALVWIEVTAKNVGRQEKAKGEETMIVEGHNKVRRAVKALAMNKLTWSSELAANAERHAKTCNTGPSDMDQRKNVGRFGVVGENTYFSLGGRKANYVAAVKAWELEGKHYDLKRNACNPEDACRNYTQMVWSTTEAVGCASSKCEIGEGKHGRSGYFIVCQYGPEGNSGDVVPFTKAASKSAVCSQCPSGMRCITREGLCSTGHQGNNTRLPHEELERELESDGDAVELEGEGANNP